MFEGIGSSISSGWNNLLGMFGGGGGNVAQAPLDYSSYMTPQTSSSIQVPTADPMGELQAPQALDYSRPLNAGNASTPTPTPSPDGGPSWKGVLGTVGDAAKVGLPLASIGAAGMGAFGSFKAGQEAAERAKLAKRAAQRQEQFTGQAANAAAPLTNFGQRQLDLVNQGQISPEAEARIQNWKAGAVQLAKSRMAASGQDNSSAMDMWNDWIESQANEMRSKELERMTGAGTGALTQGAGIYNNAAGQSGFAANVNQGQANSIDGLIGQANSVLSKLQGAAK